MRRVQAEENIAIPDMLDDVAEDVRNPKLASEIDCVAYAIRTIDKRTQAQSREAKSSLVATLDEIATKLDGTALGTQVDKVAQGIDGDEGENDER